MLNNIDEGWEWELALVHYYTAAKIAADGWEPVTALADRKNSILMRRKRLHGRPTQCPEHLWYEGQPYRCALLRGHDKNPKPTPDADYWHKTDKLPDGETFEWKTT